MPAKSIKQQRFMGMVHAAQKGEKPASADVAKVAKTISKSDAKDFAETPHKGLPNKVKAEAIKKLREYIRKRIMKEMNVTGNVAGYSTPYAFDRPGNTKKKGKKQADLTGYTVVEEIRQLSKKIKTLNENRWLALKKRYTIVKLKDNRKIALDADAVRRMKSGKDVVGNNIKTGEENWVLYKSDRPVIISENRWLELKKEALPPVSKIGRGISNINKQLAEVEKFLNWYGRIKQESGTTNEDFWKRTNSNIYRIKERLIKLEQQVRRFT